MIDTAKEDKSISVTENFIYFFKHALLTTIIIFIPVLLFAQDQEENLKLFKNWNVWSNAGRMLPRYLNEEAFAYLDKRDAAVKMLRTKEDWKARQEMARKALLASVGPFPAKTPLNPKITGTIKRDGFRIEKIIFESMPEYYVSGALFIPDNVDGKRPAILYVSGHSDPSFRSPAYQKMCSNLAKKGFVVFAIDPAGMGERLQYYDAEEGKPGIPGSPTAKHNYSGLQCFLTGTSISKYFIWDGIRAIDFLQSREEVDPARIGITGRSGGGTQSAYISAFDDRIVACAPENYFTSHRRLLESRGPQDAEQNFYHWLSKEIAIEDLLVMGMPKPTLLVTTTRDIFSIQGTREMYPKILRGYAAFGKKEDFIMVEDHAPHTSTKRNNEAIYRFFQKYLSLPGDPTDEEIDLLTRKELNVTKTGQIATSFGGETVFSINKKEAEELYRKITASRKKEKDRLAIVKRKSATLSGFRVPDKETKVVYRGSYQRDGYTVGMYALQGEGDYVVPLLLAVPDGGTMHPPVIYIHPEGKETDIGVGGNIEKLVKEGYIVAAPDLSGMGELTAELRFPAEAAFGAIIIGRSIVGIQAADIVRVVNFLKALPQVETDHVQAVAFGEECPALLHAAAYEPSISNIALIRAPVSYYNITQTKWYTFSQSFNWGVAGALTAYDLPDLAACVAPRKLAFINLLNAKKQQASHDLITDQMKFPKSVYSTAAPDKLSIVSIPETEVSRMLTTWLDK